MGGTGKYSGRIKAPVKNTDKFKSFRNRLLG